MNERDYRPQQDPPAAPRVERVGTRTLIRTGIRHNYRRVYRVVDRHLYSAPINKPLSKQEYTLEVQNLVDIHRTGDHWRVVLRSGEVCLES